MIEDDLVLRVERLRDEVEQFGLDIKARYANGASILTASALREQSSRLGERWLVEVAGNPDARQVIGEETTAELSVEFQRLLTFPDQRVPRSRYDVALRRILRDFRSRVVVPLKQARQSARPTPNTIPTPTAQSVTRLSIFLGQSFLANDKPTNDLIRRFLDAFGLEVVSGEKPKADTVSAKVRERIEASDVFMGLFTRRERIVRKQEWNTSPWVIDEKAYALAMGKKLVLLKEKGVQSIGGLQGDYEYLEFDRDDLGDLLVRLLSVLRSLTPERFP